MHYMYYEKQFVALGYETCRVSRCKNFRDHMTLSVSQKWTIRLYVKICASIITNMTVSYDHWKLISTDVSKYGFVKFLEQLFRNVYSRAQNHTKTLQVNEKIRFRWSRETMFSREMVALLFIEKNEGSIF